MNARLVRLDMTKKSNRRRFLDFPFRLYKDDPNWIPQVFADQMKTIDPSQGDYFTHAEVEFFAVEHGGKLVGTICAAEDFFRNKQSNSKDCIFGYFETVEEPVVYRLLMDAVRDFAVKRGLNRLVGPYNLDYENSYGIVVEGRERKPTMLCSQNKEYYRSYLEDDGFAPYRSRNLAFELPLNSPNKDMKTLFKVHKRLMARGQIRLRGANFKHFDSEVERVYNLINRSLAHIDDFKPWNREDLDKLLRDFKSFADPELILFAELPPASPLSQHGDRQLLIDGWEPVGFLPGLPNMNEVLAGTRGLRGLGDLFKMLTALRSQRECMAIKSVLIPPEYWAKGVSVALFGTLFQKAIERGYSWVDLSLTSETNPYTPDLAQRMGAQVYRAYQVYFYNIKN